MDATAGCDRGSEGFWMKNYRFIDYCVQVYVTLVGLLVLLFHGQREPFWHLLVALHAAAVIAVHLLIQAHAKWPRNGLLILLRHFYPIMLYPPFYAETGLLNRMFIPGYLDEFFIRLEDQMFGFQPSIAFMEKLPYLPVSELFYASYFSYYVMIVGVGLLLYLKNERCFLHYISTVSFVFYVCYLIYIFLPVVGSRVFYASVPDFPAQTTWGFFPLPYPRAVESGPFFHIMAFIYAYVESPGAAFPSSHVAVAMVTLYFSWLYRLRVRHVHVALVGLLCAATVYCRYHYVVDVLAGALTALVLLPIGERLYWKWARKNTP